MIAKNSLYDIRKLFVIIKSKSLDSSSSEERKLYQDLLKTIRYICEFNLLEEAYKNDTEFNRLLPTVKKRMVNIEDLRKRIRSKYESEEVMSREDVVRLVSLGMSYNRLSEIQKIIETKQFGHYVESMNNEIDSARQIISICSSCLDQGVILFNEVFGEDELLDKGALDFIYELASDANLRVELTEYFKRINNLDSREELLETDKGFIKYLRIIHENKDAVREYLSNFNLIGEEGERREKELVVAIKKNQETIDSLLSEFLGNIKNYAKVTELEEKIKSDGNTLEKIRTLRPKMEVVKANLESVGLGPILEQYRKKSDSKHKTVEQLVVDLLRTKSVNFDIEKIEASVNSELELLEKSLKNKDVIQKKAKEKLSDDALRLLRKDYRLVKKAVDIINAPRHNNISPLLACFVLKALADSKHLKADELNEVFKLYDKEGIENLIERSYFHVADTNEVLQDNMTDLEKRKDTDVAEFNRIVIK